MRRIAVGSLVLGGCLFTPGVAIETQTVELARGTSKDISVSVDGAPATSLDGVVWSVDDPAIASVIPAADGKHLIIGGDNEGETIVHVSSHGQTMNVDTRVGPPAIVRMWIEPETVQESRGGEVEVKAVAVDTLYRLIDVTHDCRWTVRDTSVATLDMAGMMLHAENLGQTTLHAVNGSSSAVVQVEILK